MIDCTWLIYDIMQTTDNQNVPGLLMLIDFEKAFDSMLWYFLYKTLKFYGFSDNFTKWTKLFNNDTEAFVLQCGYLSKAINIG